MTYDLANLSATQLWPYLPNLARGFELRRQFQTDIFTSRNAKEQRRATRDRPRFSCRYTAPIWTEADFREAKLRLNAAQNAPTAVPDFTRSASLASMSSAASSELELATVPDWIVDGSWLILCNAGESELVQIESIYGSTLTTASPLASNWSTGTTVRRALIGLLSGALRARQLRHGAQEFDVELSVYPSLIASEAEGSADNTLDGYDVFDQDTDFAGSPGITYQFPVEQIDFGIGRTAQFRPIEFGQELSETTHTGLSFAQVDAIEKFFLRSKGSRAAFWRASGERDVIPVSGVAGTAIDATGPLLASLRGSVDYSEEPLALQICLTDGTKFYRRVTDISANSGNSRITIASSVTFSLGELARISFMPLVRLASDDLAVEYGGSNASTIRLRFQGVRQ